MNLVILLPIIVLLVLVMVFYYARKNKAGGSGMGDRSDATERPELRGDVQWRERNK